MANNRERVMIGKTSAGVEVALLTDTLGSLSAISTGGIPTTFSAEMTITDNEAVNPGQFNVISFRPKILNEHVNGIVETLDVVESGVIVGQIFKASHDNINELALVLESAEATTTIDDIEEANDAALQAAWVLSGTNEATLETTIISPNNSSVKSMKLNLAVLNDKWTNTKSAGSWDMTDATIEFDYYQTRESGVATVTLSINDGSNTSVITLGVQAALENVWEHFSVQVNAMTGTANTAAVTNVFFQVTKKANNHFGYVDNVQFRPAPGSVSLKLWDCGSTLPVGDGASFDLTTDATQYTEIGDRGIAGTVVSEFSLSLKGGKHIYHAENFVAGAAKEHPSNTPLTVDNYYALTLNYVDTDTSVYGADTTLSISYYTNGFAFSTTAENVDITTISGAAGSGAYSDIGFWVFSTQEVYINNVFVDFMNSTGVLTDADPETEVTIFLEDITQGLRVLGVYERGIGKQIVIDISARPQLLVDGGRAQIYMNDGIVGSVASVTFGVEYLFVPPTENG